MAPFYYKDVFELPANFTEEDLKKSFRKMALKYYPDKRVNQPPDREADTAFQTLSTLRNDFLDANAGERTALLTTTVKAFPVLLRLPNEDFFRLRLIESSSTEPTLKSALGITEESAILIITPDLKPWCEIEVRLPVAEKTRITQLVDNLTAKIKAIPDLDLHFLRFLSEGGRYKRQLFRDGRSEVESVFRDFSVTIMNEAGLGSTAFTFARVAGAVGEANRQRRESGGIWRYPGLVGQLKILDGVPDEFALYVHYGLQYAWRSESDSRVKMMIYVATLALDMIFYNWSHPPVICRDAHEALFLPETSRTFYRDLVSFRGREEITEFEDSKMKKLDIISRRITYSGQV